MKSNHEHSPKTRKNGRSVGAFIGENAKDRKSEHQQRWLMRILVMYGSAFSVLFMLFIFHQVKFN